MDSKIINYTIIILLIFLKVNAVEFEGKFIQGHYILGKTNPNAEILIDKIKIKVSRTMLVIKPLIIARIIIPINGKGIWVN